MQRSTKTVAIGAFCGLIVGLLLGFLPEHSINSKLQDQNASLIESKSGIQGQLNHTQQRLQLSDLAIRSAEVSSQAQSSNYSLASANASALFTDLRKYVDATPENQITLQMKEVLSVRDRVISGLAQANPAVKPLLQQVFTKLENVSVAANQPN